jgi:outer membrane protein
MARCVILLLLVVIGVPLPAIAQTRLTLSEAIARARSNNLDVRAAAGAEREADARVSQIRGSYLPKVDLVESWQRSDQPVFVFSSLLAQRQFTAANFAIDALNHPPATDNFRTALTVDQAIYSPSTAASLRTARIGHEIAGKQRTVLNQTLAVAVTDAYGRVLVAMSSRQAAAAAVAAATADREIAGNRRDAGRATDADVLQVDVYLARVREQEIRADADERIARATLNDLMGVSLDSIFELDAAPSSAVVAPADVASLEAQALADRPELTIAALQEQMASATRDSARAAFLPQVSAQAGWEFNGAQWDSRASGWLVGAVARVNLFQGLADRARLTEATEQSHRRALEREKAQSAVRLEIRTALARLDEATAREAVGRASVAQARESQRIIRDRYESGLADVVALLRAAEAVQEANARQTAAQVDVVLASATLDRALGK